MADTKVLDITPITPPLAGTEEWYASTVGSVDVTISAAQMREYVVSNVPSNASTASQSPAASATTYLTDSVITVPSTKVRVKTKVIWRVYLSKTAAGTVGFQFQVKVGTLGTTGDTSACVFAFPVGTAVADAGYVDITWVVVGPLTSACVSTGMAMMSHQLATTGLANVNPAIVSAPTVTNFDATTATKIGLAIVVGASYVTTVQRVEASSENL